MSDEPDVRAAASAYLGLGWQPVPVPARTKGPVLDGWQNLRLSAQQVPSYFAQQAAMGGVGVQLGEVSGGLVDVDLDWKRAAIVAALLLPPTAATFGRAGHLPSHYLYRITDGPVPRRVVHTAPPSALALAGEERADILEVRGSGHQTVFPPSLHISGERVDWIPAGRQQTAGVVGLGVPSPAGIDSGVLVPLCGYVAAACLLASYWRPGLRNHLDLCLSGFLLRSGWSVETTVCFINAIAVAAGDESDLSLRKTRQRVGYTAPKVERNEDVMGWPSLAEMIDDAQITHRLSAWLPRTGARAPRPASAPAAQPDGAGAGAGAASEPPAGPTPETTHIVPLGPLLISLLDALDKPLPAGGLVGLPTGLLDLDQHLGGLRPGELIVLAGRPASGKTACALTIMQHIVTAAAGRVAFVSLEMRATELALRLLSAESGVPLRKLRDRQLTELEWAQLNPAAARLGRRPLLETAPDADHVLIDTSLYTTKQLRADMLSLNQEARLSLIVVDYLQLLRATNKNDNRVQQVGQMSRDLKGLARELDVPVLALCQLNRESEHGSDHRPQLAQLRDSGELEQDSDIVLMLYRESLYNATLPLEQQARTELLVRKNRNGPIGTVILHYLAETTRFVSAAFSDT